MDQKDRQERVEGLVSMMAESHMSDIHHRLHALERWQVGVDAFIEKQELQMSEIKSAIRNLEKSSNRVAGALIFLSVAAPVGFMLLIRLLA